MVARRKAARHSNVKPAPRRPTCAGARPALRPERQAEAQRPHKFVRAIFRPEDFKTDGLRTYAQYRDLGVKDATHGMAVAHVIRFVGQCDPKVVSKKHLHEAEFQMIYVLKGSIMTEIRRTRHAHHEGRRLRGCSRTASSTRCSTIPSDCEVLEIVHAGELQDRRTGEVSRVADRCHGRQDRYANRGGDDRACARR